MIIKISKADLLKGQPIQPGWYKAEIVDFRANPSKDAASMNYIPGFELETPEKHIINDVGACNFNSKLLSMMGPMLAALANVPLKQYLDSIKGEFDIDTDKILHKKLLIKVENKPWEGRLTNKVEGFLPYDAQVPF